MYELKPVPFEIQSLHGPKPEPFKMLCRQNIDRRCSDWIVSRKNAS